MWPVIDLNTKGDDNRYFIYLFDNFSPELFVVSSDNEVSFYFSDNKLDAVPIAEVTARILIVWSVTGGIMYSGTPISIYKPTDESRIQFIYTDSHNIYTDIYIRPSLLDFYYYCDAHGLFPAKNKVIRLIPIEDNDVMGFTDMLDMRHVMTTTDKIEIVGNTISLYIKLMYGGWQPVYIKMSSFELLRHPKKIIPPRPNKFRPFDNALSDMLIVTTSE